MNLPPLTDTHAHLDDGQYDGDRDAVVERARVEGVTQIITMGIGRDSILKTLKLTERYSGVWAAVGVHPTALRELEFGEWPILETAARHPRVVAIGETGLDYHHPPESGTESENRKDQRKYFIEQLVLARAVNKPAVIHCREAYEDTLEVLAEFGRFRDVCGVMHCFGGNRAQAERIFDLGYMISVGGILTFKNAEQLREIVKWMPRDRLLLETDCPYLSPVPYRGKRNEPAYTRLVAEKLSELWRESLEHTLDMLAKNVKRVFGIG